MRNDQDGLMFKDALPPESAWDAGPGCGGSPAAHVGVRRETVALRGPTREIPPAAEPPRRPTEADAKREPQPSPQQDKPVDKPRGGFLRRHPIKAVASLIAVLLGSAAGYVYLENAGHFETTDDAFIAARQISIAPKVSGYITAVPVTDNQHVAAGDVIARIDERDFRVALDQAEAQVAAAQDSIRSTDAQTTVQQAQVAQNQAQVEQTQASLAFAQKQATRYELLAREDSGTVQNAQLYSSQLLQQQATLKTNQAAVTAAQRQIDVLKAQRSTAEANLAQANAQRDQAALNLSYTTVTAAQSGRVVSLSAGVGEFASSGTSLAMFVPDDIWVTANFKENQLDAMRPNQAVKLEIDAYPERAVEGHVASVQPGSGTALSLLPAENATGNYVKIVQRVPVKIVIDNPPTDVALGSGMSVAPTVRTNPAPSLYEQLQARLPSLYEQARARL
jgi:membrane fusion protein (multidrug efflux system)